MASSVDTLAITIALGTLAGYLGGAIVPDSLFPRLLWPSRFYGAPQDFQPLVSTLLFMTMGGPIYKEAVRTLDGSALAGLWAECQQGDMLGTAFFEDTGKQYIIHFGKDQGETKQARNAFWLGVMTLVASASGNKDLEAKHGDETSTTKDAEVAARMPNPSALNAQSMCWNSARLRSSWLSTQINRWVCSTKEAGSRDISASYCSAKQ